MKLLYRATSKAQTWSYEMICTMIHVCDREVTVKHSYAEPYFSEHLQLSKVLTQLYSKYSYNMDQILINEKIGSSWYMMFNKTKSSS